MLQHSWYVFTILMGMATGWNVQTRADRALPFKLVVGKFAAHTIIGMAVTALLFVTSLPATALLLANQVGWYPDHTKLGKQHADEIQRYLK